MADMMLHDSSGWIIKGSTAVPGSVSDQPPHSEVAQAGRAEARVVSTVAETEVHSPALAGLGAHGSTDLPAKGGPIPELVQLGRYRS